MESLRPRRFCSVSRPESETRVDGTGCGLDSIRSVRFSGSPNLGRRGIDLADDATKSICSEKLDHALAATRSVPIEFLPLPANQVNALASPPSALGVSTRWFGWRL